jgi:hypothetical protein
MDTPRFLYPQWQKPLLRAVMETKPDSLLGKIQITERAISNRLTELEGTPGSKEERLALHDAVSTLRVLTGVLIQPERPEN